MKYLTIPNIIKILVYIFIGIIIYRILNKIITRALNKSEKKLDKETIEFKVLPIYCAALKTGTITLTLILFILATPI